jgi:hypothetical protein
MSRRTNRFQQVILMIKRHLAPDAVVTESAMLLDVVTGYEREVDVVIESHSGGHRLLVKIECRDHKRRQHVGWIDEMFGKHRDLPPGVLVLASSSGFTKQARLLAGKRQIELLKLDSSVGAAQSIADRASSLSVRTITLNPGLAVVDVESPNGERRQVNIPPHAKFYLEDGRFALTGHDVVQKLLADGIGDDSLHDIREAGPEQDSYEIDLNPATFAMGSPDNLVYLYMQRVGEDSPLWKVVRIQIVGSLKIAVDDVNWTHAVAGGTEVSYGDVEVLENNLLFVGTKNKGVEDLSVRTNDGRVFKIDQANTEGDDA